MVASEIVRRFYLTIGFVVLLGLGVLGATSTNGWMQRLGRRWKRLHRAIYVLGAIALLHYFIQSKSNVSEPVFFSGLFVWLLLWRALPMAWQRSLFALLALAVVAAFAAAGIEFAWYALATGINPWRVLAASETLQLRPASGALRGADRAGGGGAGRAAADRRDAADAATAGGLIPRGAGRRKHGRRPGAGLPPPDRRAPPANPVVIGKIARNGPARLASSGGRPSE